MIVYHDKGPAEVDRPEFSVWMFFRDGTHSPEARFITIGPAIDIAKDFINRPAAKTGIIDRIIITDGGDTIVFEWVYGKGVTWPLPQNGDGTTKGGH